MLGWRFPILDGGNEQGFNNSGIETFNGSEMYDNLAREICQNSLDAKDDSVDEPVEVHFSVVDVNIKDYPSIVELISVIDDCKEYWKARMDSKLETFFKLVEELRNNDNMSLLIASDYNTTGLTGSKAGKYEKTKWNALTHSDGVSDKGEDSGGSYGIGKNAPYVCSRLRTVFYNTYAKDEERAFQGTTRLMTHRNFNGDETVGTGLYYDKDTQKPIYADNDCKLRNLFKRSRYGTDVIMLAFDKREGWQDSIEKAIIKNFFIAIHEEKLIVHIDNNRIIDSDRLEEIIAKHSVIDEEIETYKELYEARTKKDHVIKKNRFMSDNEDDVELYIRIDEDYGRKVAELRSTGMIIRVRGKNVAKPYAAVMIVRGKELNKTLKAMEPPKHDKWDPEIIVDENERKRGKNIRGKLIKWANDTIDEICKSDYTDEIDPDGMSQFLPDELEDGKKTPTDQANSIESKQSIQKVIKRKIQTTNIKTAGRNVDGTPEEGSVNNATSGAQGGEETSGAGGGAGNERVGKPDEGTKIINRPAILKQRVYQSINGNYNASIMVEDDSDDVYISVSAMGDDGRLEEILIKEYEKDGITYKAEKSKIGPIKLKGKTMEHVSLKLEYSEKMRIKLDVQ